MPYSDREFNVKMKVSSSNNSLLDPYKKSPLWTEVSTPREKKNVDLYQDSYFLRDSREWDFTKKISRKGSQKYKE